MSEADAILAAVTHRPEEDTPRLAMADYFDDVGQPARAELIRVMIRLARHDWTDNGHTQMQLTRRMHTLVRRHKAMWLAPLKPTEPKQTGRKSQYILKPPNAARAMRIMGTMDGPFGQKTVAVQLCRGFVYLVASRSTCTLLTHLPALLAANPIDTVHFVGGYVVKIGPCIGSEGWLAELLHESTSRPVSRDARLRKNSRTEVVAELNVWLQAWFAVGAAEPEPAETTA